MTVSVHEEGAEMKRWRKAPFAFLAFILLLAGAGLAGLKLWTRRATPVVHQEQGKGGVERPAPSGVEIGKDVAIQLPLSLRDKVGLREEVAELRAIGEVVAVNGMIRSHPDRTVAVGARIEGKIVSASGLPGERIEAGQRLVEIRSVELQNLQTDLIQAWNRLGLATTDRDLARDLAARKAIAAKELLRKETDQRQAAREVEGLEARLRLIGMGVDDIERLKGATGGSPTVVLSAPISGVIVERNVVLGETVKPEQILFRLVDLSRVLAEGEAFESQAVALRPGLAVRLTVPAFPGRIFEGRIVSVGAAVDLEKRTIRFLAEVENPPGAPLRPNMFAQMSVIIGQQSKTLTIPLAAVITEGGGEVVFVASGNGYERRAVSLGVRDDRFVQVKEGLRQGERVVTTGKRQLEALYQRGDERVSDRTPLGEAGADHD